MLVDSFEATAALNKNRAVKQGSDGRISYCAADDTSFIGVTNEAPLSASPYFQSVVMDGIVQIESDGSGALAPGDQVVPAANGQIKKRTIASGTNNRLILGEVMNTVAATSGLLVDVKLKPFNVFST